MATITKAKSTTKNQVLFDKQNFLWMGIGLVVLALGFFLMAGGKSPDPKVFDDSEVYSPLRITVAPFLIVLGFCIEIYAIMRKPKRTEVVL